MNVKRFCYRMLIKNYSAEFRSEYENSILQTYDEMAYESSGTPDWGGYWGIFGSTLISVLQERTANSLRLLRPLRIRYSISLAIATTIVSVGPTGDIGNLWGPTGAVASVAQAQAANAQRVIEDPAYTGSELASKVTSDFLNER